MSEKEEKEIILGYEPWGEKIIPTTVFLAQAGGCDEYLEEAVSLEMAKAVWELIAFRKTEFSVKWGKPCYFSPEEGYYIEVARFVFKIDFRDITTFKNAGIPVELNREQKFERLRNPDASSTCPDHGGHMTHWGEWSCCGDFSFLM